MLTLLREVEPFRLAGGICALPGLSIHFGRGAGIGPRACLE